LREESLALFGKDALTQRLKQLLDAATSTPCH
jgi:hypothetical protein